jgi:hypothetical protein
MLRATVLLTAVGVLGSFAWFRCAAGTCAVCCPAADTPAPAACAQCTLSPEAHVDRRAAFDRDIRPRILEIVEVPDGFRLRFAPSDGIVANLAAWIDAERICCAFLEFRLVVSQDLGPIWLEARGNAAAKQFLNEALRPAATPAN